MKLPPPSYPVKTSSVLGFSGDIYPECEAHIKIVNENKRKAQIQTCTDGYCICAKGCHSDCPCSNPSNIEEERDGGVWESDCKDVWHLSHYE